MNYEDKNKAINLALLGSVREEILPNEDLSLYLIKYLKKNYPNALKDRFGIEDLSDFNEVISQIAKKRGLLTAGEYDLDRAYILLLKEFKDGKLGRITLEKAV